MQPVKVSHTIYPLRPPAAPDNGTLPGGAGIILQRGAGPMLTLDDEEGQEQELLARPSSAAAGTLRRGTPVASLAMESTEEAVSSGDPGVPQSPRNSTRQDSSGAVMMPRSSRSIRNSVVQTRYVGQATAVAAQGPPPQTIRRPSLSLSSPPSATPAPVDTEAAQSAGVWASGLATPKNSDRRDLNGSVQLMVPLWRGSAVEVAAPKHEVAQSSGTAPSSVAIAPTLTTQVAPVAPPGPPTPSRRASAGLSLCDDVEDSSGTCSWASGPLSTPKNSDRNDGSGGSSRLMMPRSTRSMRHSVVQARDQEESDVVPELLPQPPSTPAPGTPGRRACLSGLIHTEIAYPSTSWSSGPITTPKNADRRDLSSSVQVMAPMWRGSAAGAASYPSAEVGQPPVSLSSGYAVASQPPLAPHPPPRAVLPTGSNPGRPVVMRRINPSVGTSPLVLTQPASATELAAAATVSRCVPTAPLGPEVDQAVGGWTSGPLATPKNGDRRDVSGSVQVMAPMWRGSGASPAPRGTDVVQNSSD